MIGIVDYGSGNIGAIANLLREARIAHLVSADPAELEGADRYILPGVGAFDPTMKTLSETGLAAMLKAQVDAGKWLMGICVGMHLLARGSDEGELDGLGWIPGRVRRIETAGLNRPPLLPHMGWNSISTVGRPALLDGVDEATGAYFLHSYYFDAERDEDVVARVSYGRDFACIVATGRVIGVQFHPEKSHRNGRRLFENFAGL